MEQQLRTYGCMVYLRYNFIARDEEGKETIIQVCVDLSDNKTYEREIKAIEAAKDTLKIKNSLIITYSEQNVEIINKCPYQIRPFYEWAVSGGHSKSANLFI